jgi:hypothetical protein
VFPNETLASNLVATPPPRLPELFAAKQARGRVLAPCRSECVVRDTGYIALMAIVAPATLGNSLVPFLAFLLILGVLFARHAWRTGGRPQVQWPLLAAILLSAAVAVGVGAVAR